MHPLLATLLASTDLTGDSCQDMQAFLTHHACPHTADHSLCVGAEARRLAARFTQDERQAELAGWLHDISAIFPSDRRDRIALELGLEVLPEELAYPPILHQKLSAVIASEIFKVTDAGVLSAIRCHTTLKAGASALDKIVFVADKLQWDGTGEAPYTLQLQAGLARSLDAAAFAYLDYLWQQREYLCCVHPWMVAAQHQLAKELRLSD